MSFFEDWSHGKRWVMGLLGALIMLLIGTIVRNNLTPLPDGVRLKVSVSAEQELTSDMVSVGPSDGDWPETLNDILNLCAVRELPKGTRLTDSNIGRCEP